MFRLQYPLLHSTLYPIPVLGRGIPIFRTSKGNREIGEFEISEIKFTVFFSGKGNYVCFELLKVRNNEGSRNRDCTVDIFTGKTTEKSLDFCSKSTFSIRIIFVTTCTCVLS